MKELVLKIKWGGLGDHLFHTPIPRLAKQQGYDKVYISNHSDYRQDDIKKFVWERNPFVDGFSNEDRPYPQFGTISVGLNLLDTLVFWWGLKDDDIRFREPEIFYTPKVIPELKEAIIFDPNFGTNVGHPSSFIINKYFKEHNIIITHQMKLQQNYHPIKCKREICSKDLKHFCNIIFSCKSLFCFNTGTAPLTAALGKTATVFRTKTALDMFQHSKILSYITL